jgi:hypothetical protein
LFRIGDCCDGIRVKTYWLALLAVRAAKLPPLGGGLGGSQSAELLNQAREAARAFTGRGGLRGVLYARLRHHGCPAKMVPDFSWDAQGNFHFVPSCKTAL